MKYTPRLTKPEKSNKYYNTKSNNGYSNAIEGKCKDTGKPDTDCNVLANCVGYAYGRFHEIVNNTKMDLVSPVNAENFPEYTKCKTGKTPKLGSIIVWQKGSTLKGSDGAGHVAIVEKIDGDSIVISQSGYNSKPFWTETVKSNNGKWLCSWMGSEYKFRCFIYSPTDFDDDTTLKRGSKGDKIKELQENLRELGYSLITDGSFGSSTEKVVKDYQKDNSLEVTGIADTETLESIKKAVAKPDGVNTLKLSVDGKQVTAWGTVISGQNYIRLTDLQKLGIVKSVTYNATKKIPEIKK